MRRTLLKWMTLGLGAIVSGVLGIPAALVIGHPLRRRTTSGGEDLLPAADVDRLPEGVPVLTTLFAERFDAWNRFDHVPLGAVWLLRRGGEVTAWSTTCPHAGCFIDFEAAKQRFNCPCHGSSFGVDGARVAGPSPRPMDTLETAIKDGKVWVRFRRFRQATSDKEAV